MFLIAVAIRTREVGWFGKGIGHLGERLKVEEVLVVSSCDVGEAVERVHSGAHRTRFHSACHYEQEKESGK